MSMRTLTTFPLRVSSDLVYCELGLGHVALPAMGHWGTNPNLRVNYSSIV